MRDKMDEGMSRWVS